MFARIILALFLVLSGEAFAQQQTPLYQSGSITPGHAGKFLTNGILGDAGPAGGGAPGVGLTELGITNAGTPFCINDGPIVPGSGYHQLCLGANSLGGGLLTYNPYGTATPLPFDCLINGVFYDNCFSGGTVTSITATSPIIVTPDPITATGTVSHATTAVTPGSYTNTDLTVDEWGHITAASNGTAGTVTSITFTGDGVVDSSTPSAPVTTTGTLTATIKTQNDHTALMGPTSGGPLAPTFRQPACTDLSDAGVGCPAGAATTSTAGIAKLNNVGYMAGWGAAVNPNNIIVTTVDQASTITAIRGRVETPVGAAATVSVYKAPSGTACSAGTVLHSGSFNANGTAATNQTLTVTTSTLAAGDSICFQTTGTSDWTGGVGIGTITVFFAPT